MWYSSAFEGILFPTNGQESGPNKRRTGRWSRDRWPLLLRGRVPGLEYRGPRAQACLSGRQVLWSPDVKSLRGQRSHGLWDLCVRIGTWVDDLLHLDYELRISTKNWWLILIKNSKTYHDYIFFDKYESFKRLIIYRERIFKAHSKFSGRHYLKTIAQSWI